MFTISIAGLNIGIDNRFQYIENRCAPFITNEPPEFTVRAGKEDLLREAKENHVMLAIAEMTCLYREIAKRLPLYQAFVMHGATMQTKGKAYIFTARSGTGKTTHVLLWKKVYGDAVSIVNGDKPIIRLIDGQFYACGTPWNGKEKFGTNEMVPVAGLCFLNRGEENCIVKTDAAQTLGDMIHQIYFPPDRTQMEKFLGLLDSFLARTPLYKLYCNMEDSAAVLSYEAMTAAE